MVDIFMSAANSPAANFAAPVANTNRIDDGFYVGTTWQVTPPLLLTAAAYYDHSRNALERRRRHARPRRALLGRAACRVLVVQAHGSVWHGRLHPRYGRGEADFPGRNNQTGVAFGLRNIF